MTDITACSNMKHTMAALNNNVTVKKKHFARCQTEEEVMAEVVMATVEVEVQVEHQEDPETITTAMTSQKRWSLHHTGLEEINKVQHAMQLKSKLCMTSEDNTNSGTI